MERLELKHLVGYLPCGLQGIFHTGYNGGLDIKQEVIGLGNSYVTYRNTCSQCVDVQLLNFKPILRPLSDFRDINSKYMNDLNWDISLQLDLVDLATKGGYWTKSHLLIDECAKAHVDFQDLIPKNLAIDINTLNK